MSDPNNKFATIPAPIKTPLPALGGRPTAIVPQDFEAAYRMANVVVKAGMAPKSFDTTEKACVAIMHGLEVGLTPMAALQSIAVVNGMPTIWGDGLLALIQGSGLLEDMEEHTEYDDKGEPQYATCTMKRVGRPSPATQMFTRVQAAKAGLLGKAGPWTQYPGRMMQMRARSWCARDLFADVLRGLHNTEETMDMVDITDRASATTTAPAEPRRGDFQPTPTPTPTEPEAERWELFDEVGEQFGPFEVGEWVDKFTHMATGKMLDKERAQLLENNADTAKAIWEATDDEKLAEHLKALYTPAEPEQTQPTDVKDWSLPAGIVGQERILQAIYAMLYGKPEAATKVEVAAEVDLLWEAHEAFMEKLGNIKRADANQRFGNRKIELAQAAQQAAE